MLTKETKILSFKSDLYIHERHKGGGRLPQEEILASKSSRLQASNPSSRLTNGRAAEDFVDGPGHKMMNGGPNSGHPDSDTVSSDVKDFVISGVIDPATEKKLTVSKALAKGVLNKEFGLYNNLETGESMPIAEAIARGFITVDYVDVQPSSSAGMVNGNGIHVLTNGQNGLEDKNMLNSMEIKKFDLTGVVDPRTGEIISATEAIEAGIIDPNTGRELLPFLYAFLIFFM